jgi:hypothetical protein
LTCTTIATQNVFVASKGPIATWQGTPIEFMKLIKIKVSCLNLDIHNSKEVFLITWIQSENYVLFHGLNTNERMTCWTTCLWFGNTTQRFWCMTKCLYHWLSTTKINPTKTQINFLIPNEHHHNQNPCGYAHWRKMFQSNLPFGFWFIMEKKTNL